MVIPAAISAATSGSNTAGPKVGNTSMSYCRSGAPDCAGRQQREQPLGRVEIGGRQRSSKAFSAARCWACGTGVAMRGIVSPATA